MTDTSQHLFWITSRAAGITALLAASAAVGLGLLMGTRLVRGRRAVDARTLHEVLSLTTLVSLAVHALSLLGDSFLHPSLAALAIPFVSAHSRWWTAVGIFGGYGLAVLGLSFYARRRIGTARWRKAHRFTALAWILGIAHSLGEGTDSGKAWFLALVGIAVVPSLLLLIARLAGVRRQPKKRIPTCRPNTAAPAPAASASQLWAGR